MHAILRAREDYLLDMKKLFAIIVVLIYAIVGFAGTSVGSISEVIGAYATNETVSGSGRPIYVYDGVSEVITFKATVSKQKYEGQSWRLYFRTGLDQGDTYPHAVGNITVTKLSENSYRLVASMSASLLHDKLINNDVCFCAGTYGTSHNYNTPPVYIRKSELVTITWNNYDASTITTSKIPIGITPTYTGSTPTRPADAQYTYTFSGWTPDIVAATANKTYTAVYTSEERFYSAETGVNDAALGQASVEKEQQEPVTSGQYTFGEKVVFTATPNAGCRFVQWNDGNTANPRTVTITQDTALTAVLERILPKQTGALLGVFAVAEDKYVCFSQGNLQYSPNYYGTGSWQFASTQYEYLGTLNQTDRSVIDLIGWGATGYGSTDPSSVRDNINDNAPNSAPLTGTNYDWGKYCSIGYGGNKPGLWRTMDNEEWEYLINGRPNAQIHKGKAKVNGVKGYIFLPEEWQCPASLTFSYALNDYTDNVYSESQWTAMEKAGAVFLPAQGGYRTKDVMVQYETEGRYWTAGTNGYYASGKNYAYSLMLAANGISILSSSWTSLGMAVRLVCDTAYVPAQCTITVSANPEHGSVTGGGAYANGASAQLTATPNECYEFVQWSDGNTDNPRTVTVTKDATYTAEFEQLSYTVKGQEATGGHVEVEK